MEYQPLAQLGGTNGYFRADHDGSNRKIVVGTDLDEAARAKTLIHEIAHMRLHVDSQGMARSTQEIEAESTAYVVAAQFGLDTSQYTFRYVGGWSGYDADAIRETAQRVIDISGEITDAVRVIEETSTNDAAKERASDLTSRTEVIAQQATETADSLEAAWRDALHVGADPRDVMAMATTDIDDARDFDRLIAYRIRHVTKCDKGTTTPFRLRRRRRGAPTTSSTCG